MTRMSVYLIDTDWVIDCLRGVPSVARQFDRLLPEGIGLSIVSLAELLDGVVGSDRRSESELMLWEFLEDLEIINLDRETCLIFAEERVRLRSAGTIIGDMDLLIGATAMRHGLTLLTNNRRHFGRLQGLDIISA